MISYAIEQASPRHHSIQTIARRGKVVQGILQEESSNRLVIEQQLHVRKPRRQFGRVAIGKGYLAEWVILRGRWYDVGKFYDSKRRLTGYYCDIIRPVTRLLSDTTKTSIITDLFLDLWITPEGRYVVLDEDKLERALANHVISTSLARLRSEGIAKSNSIDPSRPLPSDFS